MSDIDALNAALAVEHRAVYAYGVLGPKVSAGAALAQAGYAGHRVWRDRLAALVTQLGGTPAVSAPAYSVGGPVGTPAQGAALAIAVEDACAVAYERLVVAVSTAELRSTGASALVEVATRGAHWRSLAGAGPSPAFPGRG